MSDTAKPAPDFGSGLSRAMRWAMTERVWALFVVGIVTALVLVFALIVMATNLLVDLTYALLNPRIRYG